jgi:hypothetical protein
MALTKIQNPQELTPAYNQMVWVFNSTNVNQNGFRYIFTITNGSGTQLAKLPVAAEPTYGYGYVDISKIISDYLTYDINTTGVTNSCSNSMIKYNVNISESYLYSWDFTDNAYRTGGYLGFKGTTQPQFIVGDTIEVYQDSPFTNTSYEGQTTITGVTYSGGLWYITTNKPFGSSSPVEPGTIYYANRTKTINVGSTYSNYYAFNGRRSHSDFIGWSASEWMIGSTTNSTDYFLTDLPDNFYMTEDQDMWLNMFKGTESNTSTSVYFENSNGDTFKYDYIWTSSYGDTRIGQLAVGPNNATYSLVSGTGSLIKSTTEWYDIYLKNTTSQLSRKYRVYLDTRCKIEDYEILFMDRMGSFVSYAFQLRSKETGNIERMDYNQFLGTINTSGWSYRNEDAGSTIYSVNFDKQLELKTNWMTDEMSVYFEQLLTSPVTYLKVDGVYQPVIVQDNGYTTERQRNKILIQKNIIVKFANKEISNI